MSTQHPNPLDALAPTEGELRAAADLADLGQRLAFPLLFDPMHHDGLGADPEPIAAPVAIDPDVVYIMGGELSDAREAILNSGRCLPLAGNQPMHRRLNDLVNEIDDIASVLGERSAA